MKNLDLKKVYPILAGIAIFLIVTLFYFSPLLEGKRLFQSDVVHHQGAAKELIDYRNQTGEEALWTNSMFGGMPAYQISVKYTANLIRHFDRLFQLYLPGPANLVFLYFIGFFILLLVMKVDPWLSIAGAIAFGLSSFFFQVIDAGHNSQAHAIGYMAPALAGIILTFRKQYIWGGIMTAFFLSLELLANHPQITYYLMLIALVYGISEMVRAIREKEYFPFLKSVGVIFIAVLFAFLTNITSLWATYEYGKYTIRGATELSSEKENRTTGLDRDYVTQWSYGKAETFTLLFPSVYGGSSSLKVSTNSKVADAMRANSVDESNIRQFLESPAGFMYWGNQPFTSGPVYVGAIICFLFLLGLFIVKGNLKWWLLFITVLSILLAWGHNFMAFTNFFLDYLPGYNKFRAVTMTLVIAEFAMPLLAILALKEIYDNPKDKDRIFKGVKYATIILGGLALIFAAVPDMFFNFIGPNDKMFQEQYQFPEWLIQGIRDERLAMFRLDAIRALVFILLTAGLVWAVLFNKLKKQFVPFILLALILTDMVIVNKRYTNNESFVSGTKVEKPYEPTAIDQQILQDTTLDYRVFNASVNTFNDASTSFFHKSIGGYHGAKLRRYQELIDHQIANNNFEVLNMLNTRYIIYRGQNREPVVQFNPEACGNAWFVKDYKLVNNPDEEIKALDKFHPKDTAIIDQQFKDLLSTYKAGRDSLDEIKLIDYKPNQLTYTYSTKNPGLAVFAEIYYPKGWNVTIDGQPAQHFRANYVLRAMVLPAGQHKVEFKFQPAAYYTGEKISFASSLLLLLLVIGFGGWQIKKTLSTKA